MAFAVAGVEFGSPFDVGRLWPLPEYAGIGQHDGDRAARRRNVSKYSSLCRRRGWVEQRWFTDTRNTSMYEIQTRKGGRVTAAQSGAEEKQDPGNLT